MHANNEIGNLSDIYAIGNLCKKYNAIFHSDTVQTVGHFPFDLRNMPVHFITGAAHKFHGPKGVGMLYINENIKIHPFINGGSQERNMRAGTENLYALSALPKRCRLLLTIMKKIQQPSTIYACIWQIVYKKKYPHHFSWRYVWQNTVYHFKCRLAANR